MSARIRSSCSSRVPLFSELSADELERISRVAVPSAPFPAGVRVFHEGDHSDACYLVRLGRPAGHPRALRRAGDRPRDPWPRGHLRGARDVRRRGTLGERRDAHGLRAPGAPGRGLPPPARRSPGDRREADRRPHPAAAGDERAGLPAVVSDRAQPGRRGAHPAGRRGGRGRGASGGDDPDDAGGPRPARGHLARERVPLPGHPRARRVWSGSVAARVTVLEPRRLHAYIF